jgi:hypothetical protein
MAAPYQHISHGFYYVSDAIAGQLARAVNAKLPGPGRELRVEVAPGVLGWLSKTPTRMLAGFPKRGWSWSISRFSDDRFVPSASPKKRASSGGGASVVTFKDIKLAKKLGSLT